MPWFMFRESFEAMTRRRLTVIFGCSCLMLIMGTAAFAQDEPSMAPDQNQGAQIFSSQCAYCHGADGRGGRAPAIATLPNVIAKSNQDLLGHCAQGRGRPGYAGIS